MLEPHQRAALIPNEPGVSWHDFLSGRFIDSRPHTGGTSLAIVVQTVQQQSETDAALHGLVEVSAGGSLPVVSEFHGELNLETREITIHQSHPDKHYSGQISDNGRVLVLRESGQSRPVHLVHEETLSQLV